MCLNFGLNRKRHTKKWYFNAEGTKVGKGDHDSVANHVVLMVLNVVRATSTERNHFNKWRFQPGREGGLLLCSGARLQVQLDRVDSHQLLGLEAAL